jgi:hypothetical protein
MPDTPRPQLIHLDVDRRLGHEWDEWDGSPLPNGGDFTSPPHLFFIWSAAALGIVLAGIALVLYLLSPRLGLLHPAIPTALWTAVAVVSAGAWAWWGALLLSYRLDKVLLPGALAERGLFLRLMSVTSRVAVWFGRRDWVENAAVQVYNALASNRAEGEAGRRLLLIPRASRSRPSTACSRWRGGTRCRSSWRPAASSPGA